MVDGRAPWAAASGGSCDGWARLIVVPSLPLPVSHANSWSGLLVSAFAAASPSFIPASGALTPRVHAIGKWLGDAAATRALAAAARARSGEGVRLVGEVSIAWKAARSACCDADAARMSASRCSCRRRAIAACCLALSMGGGRAAAMAIWNMARSISIWEVTSRRRSSMTGPAAASAASCTIVATLAASATLAAAAAASAAAAAFAASSSLSARI